MIINRGGVNIEIPSPEKFNPARHDMETGHGKPGPESMEDYSKGTVKAST